MKNLQTQLSEIKQKNLKPIYMIKGTEQYLIDKAKETLVDSVLENEEEEEFNFGSFNMKEVTINQAIQEAESFPFFGERRLIFIIDPYFLTGEKAKNEPKHNLKELESYIQNPSDFSIVVFFAPYEKLDKRKKITKLLNKEAEVLDVQPMKEKQLTAYVKQVCKAKGYQMKDQTFELLLNRTGYDLTKLISELEKLFIFYSDTKFIEKSSVETLVTKSLEHNVFEINDLVLNKEVKGAMEVFQDLVLQKEDPIKIIALMIGQFRLLIQVKILRAKGYQQGDIASVLKVHPYRVKLAMQKERKFNQTLLSNAYHQLIDSDFKIKAGQVDPEIQFELFVMKFSETQNEMDVG